LIKEIALQAEMPLVKVMSAFIGEDSPDQGELIEKIKKVGRINQDDCVLSALSGSQIRDTPMTAS
jgi:hypothetical protein